MGAPFRLRPSAAKTWTTCTAQPWAVKAAMDAGRIVEEIKDYTEAGTKAHALAESMLRKGTPGVSPEALEQFGVPEDDAASVKLYVDYVRRLAGNTPIAVESRVSLPWGGTGTIDAAILREDGDVILDIMDYKHGVGVGVDSDALQLRIYAGSYLVSLANDGLVDLLAILDKKVRLHVVQPRFREFDGVEPHETTVRAIVDNLDGVVSIAEEILAANGTDGLKFTPSEEGCQFCPLGGICHARGKAGLAALPAEAAVAVLAPDAPVTLPDPETLTDEQVAKAIAIGPLLSKWLDKVEAMAAARLMAGQEVHGLKVVEGRSNRKWASEGDAAKLLKNYLSTDDIYTRKLVSPAQAEAMLKGKETSTKFENKLATLIVRDAGKPKVVPADDKRPAISPSKPAEQVFGIEPVLDSDGI